MTADLPVIGLAFGQPTLHVAASEVPPRLLYHQAQNDRSQFPDRLTNPISHR